MLRSGAWQFYRANRKYISAKLRGMRTAETYVLTNVLEEPTEDRFDTVALRHGALPGVARAPGPSGSEKPH